MANDFTANPWICDTATVVTQELVRIKGIRWVGATTAGHAATIKDNNSHIVWTSVASGSNYVEADHLYFTPGLNFRGFNVTSIQSGVLYIELL